MQGIRTGRAGMIMRSWSWTAVETQEKQRGIIPKSFLDGAFDLKARCSLVFRVFRNNDVRGLNIVTMVFQGILLLRLMSWTRIYGMF